MLWAQGTVYFAVGPNAGVRDGFTGQPVPPGNSFLAALYYAPDGVMDDSQFVQLGNAIGFGSSGAYNGGIRTTPANIPPGGFAMLQVRAWESAYGTTYEEAVAAPEQNGRGALTGKSIIIRYDTCPPPTASPICDPSSLEAQGMRSFVVTIPEPSPAVILAAGLVLAVCVARKFRSQAAR